MRSPTARRRRGHDDEERLAARAAVGEQQLVAAHPLERRAACRSMRKKPSGKRRADVARRARADDDAARVPREAHRHRVGAVVAVERDVVRDQEARGAPAATATESRARGDRSAPSERTSITPPACV